MTKNATRDAFRQLLESLGIPPRGELRRTPARAASLWRDHLLKGQQRDLAPLLARSLPSRARGAVMLRDLDVHMVCPHHLTVAFGTAHVAYLPGGRLAPLGAIGELVDVCTSRLVLQEDATTMIADALVEHLGARAAAATISATHPCHNVTRPHAHASETVTWARAGEPQAAAELEAKLSPPRRTGRRAPRRTTKGSKKR